MEAELITALNGIASAIRTVGIVIAIEVLGIILAIIVTSFRR